jgi:hypothetical protein
MEAGAVLVVGAGLTGRSSELVVVVPPVMSSSLLLHPASSAAKPSAARPSLRRVALGRVPLPAPQAFDATVIAFLLANWPLIRVTL